MSNRRLPHDREPLGWLFSFGIPAALALVPCYIARCLWPDLHLTLAFAWFVLFLTLVVLLSGPLDDLASRFLNDLDRNR